jgi:aerobic-type carbon monoxide dehydrogenase small subunit (CoxS/CutS family)
MSDQSERGVSRRGFIKGVGATTVAAGLLSGRVARAEDGQPLVVGPGPVTIELEVDGQMRKVECEPRRTLLDLLRDDLEVTAPKRVCDRGSCGACTVLVDGVPRLGCMNLAIEAAGSKVTTAAGLGTPEALHPLQEAFHEHDAHQCGFCTPGFVTHLSALFAGGHRPTEEEIREATTGNLCRCGTQPRVRAAARALARRD